VTSNLEKAFQPDSKQPQRVDLEILHCLFGHLSYMQEIIQEQQIQILDIIQKQPIKSILDETLQLEQSITEIQKQQTNIQTLLTVLNPKSLNTEFLTEIVSKLPSSIIKIAQPVVAESTTTRTGYYAKITYRGNTFYTSDIYTNEQWAIRLQQNLIDQYDKVIGKYGDDKMQLIEDIDGQSNQSAQENWRNYITSFFTNFVIPSTTSVEETGRDDGTDHPKWHSNSFFNPNPVIVAIVIKCRVHDKIDK
jgi:hypothetical protein